MAGVPDKPASNTALTALNWMLAAGIVVGVILLIVGIAGGGGYDPGANVPYFVLGGIFFNIGLLALFSRLTVAAVRWGIADE